MISWLLSNTITAILLATVVAGMIWMFRPSPAVRHALWLVVLIRLVSPTGLIFEVPLPIATESAPESCPPIPSPPDRESSEVLATLERQMPEVPVEFVAVQVGNPEPVGRAASPDQTISTRTSDDRAAYAFNPLIGSPAQWNDAAPTGHTTTLACEPSSPAQKWSSRLARINWFAVALVPWILGALACGFVQFRQTRRFARFAGQSVTAPDWLHSEVAAVAAKMNVRTPRVRVLAGLLSPVMWCLGRPTLLWPLGLEQRLHGEGRRAVLAHELAHLCRRDHWVRRLEMIAAVLHWWNPLFWIARKRIRTDAELACDGWATREADCRVYAEALLEVCTFHPHRHVGRLGRPAPAVGAIGEGQREMKERLTMIMRNSATGRLASGAKLVVALVAIASVPALTVGQSKPVPSADAKVIEVKIAEAKAAETKLIEEKIEALKKQLAALKSNPAKSAEKTAEKTIVVEVVKPESTKDVKVQTTTKLETIKVIGPDGKELKDVKVIVMDAAKAADGKTVTVHTQATDAPKVVSGQKILIAPGHQGQAHAASPAHLSGAVTARIKTDDGQSVMLTRSTYKMSKEQIASLQTLLGGIKGGVMETKVDGDSITITTTPDRMHAVGAFVGLVTGQSGGAKFSFVPGQFQMSEFKVDTMKEFKTFELSVDTTKPSVGMKVTEKKPDVKKPDTKKPEETKSEKK